MLLVVLRPSHFFGLTVDSNKSFARQIQFEDLCRTGAGCWIKMNALNLRAFIYLDKNSHLLLYRVQRRCPLKQDDIVAYVRKKLFVVLFNSLLSGDICIYF